MSRQTILKALLFMYLAIVMLLSVVPFSTSGVSFNSVHVLSLRLDYLLHALVFIPLVPLWRISRPGIPLWLVFVLSLCVAAAAEGIHYFVPYRSYNVNDLLGNITGVVLGVAIAVVINQWTVKKPFSAT